VLVEVLVLVLVEVLVLVLVEVLMEVVDYKYLPDYNNSLNPDGVLQHSFVH
jgi:hypothetical protein